MNTIDNCSRKRISAIWPVALIGLPILVTAFLLIGSMYEGGTENFWLALFSKILIFSLMVFSLFTFIFSLYSSYSIIRSGSVVVGVLSFVGSFLSMGILSYFFYGFWRSQNVDLFSLRNKRFFDIFSCFFYFIIVFVILISVYFVGHDFEVF